MGLVERLTGQRVCIDTAPFIYYIERKEKYSAFLNPLFDEIAAGNIDAFTSAITLIEVLVHPFRTGNTALAEKYRDILLNAEGLTTFGIHHEISFEAARLRASYAIKTPDAIQIATGKVYGADTFVTNDAGLRKIPEINVLLLDDL